MRRERRLLDAIAAGDAESLGELYDWYGPGAYRLVLTIAADRELAEQVVESAFVSLWRGAARDLHPGSVAQWLVAFVRDAAAVRADLASSRGVGDPHPPLPLRRIV